MEILSKLASNVDSWHAEAFGLEYRSAYTCHWDAIRAEVVPQRPACMYY